MLRNVMRRYLLTGSMATFMAATMSTKLKAQGAPQLSPLSPLTIVTRDGKRHTFQVETADNDTTRAQGLMFRREMAADRGMLFDYGQGAREVSMWMKNTYLPLDMLFIRKDGTIANIAERTIPQSTASVYSDGVVRAVLELNGGTCAKLGIKPGDKVEHNLFGNLSS